MSRRLLDLVARLGAARLVVAAALGLYFLPLALGKDLRFRLGVHALETRFLDLRSITSGWECDDRGIDVLRADPCDPLDRPFNYPRLWLLPGELGLGPDDTFWLGVVLVVAFLLAALVFVGRGSWLRGLAFSAVLLSPPVMLGVERGNSDLAVFVVLVVALALLAARATVVRAAGNALFLVAAMLKLFPAFGLLTLLRQRGRWLAAGLVVGGLFVLYALVTLDDLRLIKAGTPTGIVNAYGAAVARDELVGYGEDSLLAHALPVLIALGGVALALGGRALLRGAPAAFAPERTPELDAFWTGGAIYAGTYAFLYDTDYRLLFLLLTVPQLLRWAGERRPALPLPWLALITLLVTLWFSTDSRAVPVIGWIWPRWNAHVSLSIDELSGWLLFAFVVAGLASTLPRQRFQSGQSASRTSTRAAPPA